MIAIVRKKLKCEIRILYSILLHCTALHLLFCILITMFEYLTLLVKHKLKQTTIITFTI